MVVLDATPGGATSNSYTDRTFALDHLTTARLYGTAFSGASVADQDASLIWATRLIDTGWCFDGSPTYANQALAFPMSGLVDRYNRYVDSTTIPLLVQQATAEFADYLIQQNVFAVTTPSTTAGGAVLTKQKLDVLELGYSLSTSSGSGGSGGTSGTVAIDSIPRMVIQYLSQWGALKPHTQADGGGLFAQTFRS